MYIQGDFSFIQMRIGIYTYENRHKIVYVGGQEFYFSEIRIKHSNVRNQYIILMNRKEILHLSLL